MSERLEILYAAEPYSVSLTLEYDSSRDTCIMMSVDLAQIVLCVRVK